MSDEQKCDESSANCSLSHVTCTRFTTLSQSHFPLTGSFVFNRNVKAQKVVTKAQKK